MNCIIVAGGCAAEVAKIGVVVHLDSLHQHLVFIDILVAIFLHEPRHHLGADIVLYELLVVNKLLLVVVLQILLEVRVLRLRSILWSTPHPRSSGI